MICTLKGVMRVDIDCFIKDPNKIPFYVGDDERFRYQTLESLVRKQTQACNGSGRIQEKVEQADFRELLADLMEHGFLPTTGYSQENLAQGERDPVWKAHFSLFPPDRHEVDEPLDHGHVNSLVNDIAQLFNSAFWSIEVFWNKLRRGGQLIDDEFSITITLRGRVPLLDADGELLLQWERPRNKRDRGLKLPIPALGIVRVRDSKLLIEPTP